MNGKPLILFFATGEQRNLDSVLAFVNKYHLYDELDINLMCVSFAGNYSQKGWENVAEELAEYLKQEWEKHSFPIIIDCAGNGAYGGCCMARALSDRGMKIALEVIDALHSTHPDGMREDYLDEAMHGAFTPAQTKEYYRKLMAEYATRE